MALVGFVTYTIQSLWLLLLCRILLSVVVYYAVLKLAKVNILAESEAFIKGKLRK